MKVWYQSEIYICHITSDDIELLATYAPEDRHETVDGLLKHAKQIFKGEVPEDDICGPFCVDKDCTERITQGLDKYPAIQFEAEPYVCRIQIYEWHASYRMMDEKCAPLYSEMLGDTQ